MVAEVIHIDDSRVIVRIEDENRGGALQVELAIAWMLNGVVDWDTNWSEGSNRVNWRQGFEGKLRDVCSRR